MLLKVDHVTEYGYLRPVGFPPHQLRLLPRSVPGLNLLRSELTVSPDATVHWNLDASENIVGRAVFPGTASHLRIASTLLIERSVTNPFDFLLEEGALSFPVSYTDRERTMLAPYFQNGPDTIPAGWLAPFLGQGTTLGILTGINHAVFRSFRYRERHEVGVRCAAETISLGEGTCRDFAALFLEAARHLGIPARYVSGYLCSSPDGTGGDSHTHGWCELYLPGAGWRGFDPTNGILAGPHHVPVAVSVGAGEIPPVEGAYCGESDLCISHKVNISARELLPGEVE